MLGVSLHNMDSGCLELPRSWSSALMTGQSWQLSYVLPWKGKQASTIVNTVEKRIVGEGGGRRGPNQWTLKQHRPQQTKALEAHGIMAHVHISDTADHWIAFNSVHYRILGKFTHSWHSYNSIWITSEIEVDKRTVELVYCSWRWWSWQPIVTFQ